ncbi:MAG: metal ABC transporter permease [Coprobacter sp.]|nr:metal ABC transporter permease [Coprobacter sp.]
MEIVQYTFFRNALWAVLLIGIAGGIIGTYIVTRRMVFITGGITHASFGGLGIGLFMGINPTIMAMLFAIGSALGVGWLSRRATVREDSAIAALWALGMAVGIICIFKTPGYTPGLTEFLFGNILTITTGDLIWFALYTMALVLLFALCYRQLIAVAFDADFAATRRLPVRLIDYTMVVMVSLCVVLTIRLVGIMLLLSMLTVPQMTVELFTRRYRLLQVASGVLTIVAGVIGLFVAYGLDVPAGACIVFILILLYAVARVAVWLRARSRISHDRQ